MPPSSARSRKSSIMTEYRDYFAARRVTMVATLRQLVEHESPSSNKAAVDELGQLLAQKFGEIGGEVEMYPSLNYGNHLQADFPGRNDGAKPIMLLGHFDTVWDVGTLKQ